MIAKAKDFFIFNKQEDLLPFLIREKDLVPCYLVVHEDIIYRYHVETMNILLERVTGRFKLVLHNFCVSAEISAEDLDKVKTYVKYVEKVLEPRRLGKH